MVIRYQPGLSNTNLTVTGEALQWAAGENSGETTRPPDQSVSIDNEKVTYLGVNPAQGASSLQRPHSRLFKLQTASEDAEAGLSLLRNEPDLIPQSHRRLVIDEMKGWEKQDEARQKLNPTGSLFEKNHGDAQNVPAVGAWNRITALEPSLKKLPQRYSLNKNALHQSHLAADGYDQEQNVKTLQGEQHRKLMELAEKQPHTNVASLKTQQARSAQGHKLRPKGAKARYDRSTDYGNAAFHAALALAI